MTEGLVLCSILQLLLLLMENVDFSNSFGEQVLYTYIHFKEEICYL